jgi:hypothetical protein
MANTNLANVVVFILFFGLALVEALKNQNWLEAGLFAALGIVSLWADIRKK